MITFCLQGTLGCATVFHSVAASCAKCFFHEPQLPLPWATGEEFKSIYIHPETLFFFLPLALMIKLKLNDQPHAATPAKDLFARKQMVLLLPKVPALKELHNLSFFSSSFWDGKNLFQFNLNPPSLPCSGETSFWSKWRRSWAGSSTHLPEWSA